MWQSYWEGHTLRWEWSFSLEERQAPSQASDKVWDLNSLEDPFLPQCAVHLGQLHFLKIRWSVSSEPGHQVRIQTAKVSTEFWTMSFPIFVLSKMEVQILLLKKCRGYVSFDDVSEIGRKFWLWVMKVPWQVIINLKIITVRNIYMNKV